MQLMREHPAERRFVASSHRTRTTRGAGHRCGTARRALVLGAAVALICWSALPAAAQEAGICDRTDGVERKIVTQIQAEVRFDPERFPEFASPEQVTCGSIGAQHLAIIDALVAGTVPMKSGDFDGLTGLTDLMLRSRKTTYPADIFQDLTALTTLWFRPLYGETRLHSLPTGIFERTTKLRWLRITPYIREPLPYRIFENVPDLESLNIENMIWAGPAARP